MTEECEYPMCLFSRDQEENKLCGLCDYRRERIREKRKEIQLVDLDISTLSLTRVIVD